MEEFTNIIKNTKVLVVDEQDDHRELICQALKSYGFNEDNLVCCYNIKQVADVINNVQLVFLEASEKKCELGDGYAMHIAVKEWNDLGKDVFISAYARDLGKFTRVATIYATQFISKPLNIVTLTSALNHWIKRLYIDKQLYSSKRCLCGGKHEKSDRIL